MYERILGFEAYPKFYPEGSSAISDPLGPNSDLLPLNRNVTFSFNYTQGTIQTLYFFELVNGNNVSLLNVSVPLGTEVRNFSVDIPFTEVGSIQLRINRNCNELRVSFQPGLHQIYVVPSNALEDGSSTNVSFTLIVGVFNWTVTALTPWIKEDPSMLHFIQI